VDPSARQRKLVFIGIVVVLVALGAYLVWPKSSGPHTASPPSHPSTPASSQPAAVPTPTQTGSATGSSQVNIYQWLPFTQADLAKASAVTTEFSAYYETYSYTESTSEYVSRMSGLATSQLDGVLANAYSTPGVASTRQQQKQVASGTAVIDSLRAFGATSLTFVVTINQKITTTSGTKQQSQQFAVTVASNGGGSWQVNNIQLASAGNT
jgi:hypothetical protein